MGQSLLTFAIVLLVASTTGFAATLTVTTSGDVSDGGDGVLSLREAIDAAAAFDTIEFDPSLSGQTIGLTQGTITLSTSVQIVGPGADELTIDGNELGRVFFIDSGATVLVSGLTVSGGNHTGAGAGIRNDGGQLTVIECVLRENTTGFAGAALANFFGLGLDVVDSVIEENTAGIGAGVFINFGPVNIVGTTIRNNQGGSIWNLGGTVTVESSTISGNVVDSNDGGSGLLTTGTSRVINSTISGNISTGLFGGFGSGGGVKINAGTLEIANSTIVANSAFTSGGGVAIGVASIVNVRNSIIAGNTAPVGEDCDFAVGTPTSIGFNVVGDATGCPSDGPGDQVVDPALVFTDLVGSLANNGGLTETHALLAGSPALDMGDPAGCEDPDGAPIVVDQRGETRPAGPSCDVGSFESQGAPLGGTVTGLQQTSVVCTNVETLENVAISDETSWDCRAAGLDAEDGDRVRQDISGRPSAPSWSGDLVGLDDSRIRVLCLNLSTGQRVPLQLTGETSFDCRNAGLLAQPGDRLRLTILGRADG